MPRENHYLKNNSSPFAQAGVIFLWNILWETIISIMLLCIHNPYRPPPFPTYITETGRWHNRPAFTLFLVLPLSDFSDKGYYTLFFCIFQVFLRIGFVGFLKFFLHIPLCFTFYINIEICQHLNGDFTNFILFRR